MLDNIKLIDCRTDGTAFEKYNWKFFKQYENDLVYIHSIKNPDAVYKGNAKLLLFYKVNTKTDVKKITIIGSLRKWYFGKNVRRDLTKSEVDKCITLLAELLYVKRADMLNAIITKVEFGATMFLPAKFRILYDCFYAYPYYRRCNYKEKNETLYFFGKEKSKTQSSKFYDKLLEINKDNPAKLKKIEKANSKIFFCRYEVKIKSVSQVKKFGIKTVQELLQEWDFVIDYVYRSASVVKFVDYVSPLKNDIRINRKYKQRYQYIQRLGLAKYFANLDVLNKRNYRDVVKQREIAFIKKYSAGNYSDVKNAFLFKLIKKLQKLNV